MPPRRKIFLQKVWCCTKYISREKKKYKNISQDIDTIVSRLTNNTNSLIMDVDNNACEQLNSVINKFLGGKRINFTQKSSYSTRVHAAVVSYNSEEYLRAVKKHIAHTSPGKH